MPRSIDVRMSPGELWSQLAHDSRMENTGHLVRNDSTGTCPSWEFFGATRGRVHCCDGMSEIVSATMMFLKFFMIEPVGYGMPHRPAQLTVRGFTYIFAEATTSSGVDVEARTQWSSTPQVSRVTCQVCDN